MACRFGRNREMRCSLRELPSASDLEKSGPSAARQQWWGYAAGWPMGLTPTGVESKVVIHFSGRYNNSGKGGMVEGT